MSNYWFQESSDWKPWHDGACVFSLTHLLFPAFVSILYIAVGILKQK